MCKKRKNIKESVAYFPLGDSMSSKETTINVVTHHPQYMFLLIWVQERMMKLYGEGLQEALDDHSIGKDGKPYEPFFIMRYVDFPPYLSKHHTANFLRCLEYLKVVEMRYDGVKGRLTAHIRLRNYVDTFGALISDVRKRMEQQQTE